MSSAIVLNNRIVWATRDRRVVQPKQTWIHGLVEDEDAIDCVSAIPPDPESIARLPGSIFFDQAEDLNYRVVDHLNPKHGWASTAFWQDRGNIDHRAVLALARAGFFEPGMEYGSQVRRFRCPDEGRMKLSTVWRAEKTRVSKARSAERMKHEKLQRQQDKQRRR